MQGKRLLAAAVAAVTAGAAQADDAAELNPVTVTASRNAESVQESLSAVSVISREDIERLQPQSVLDLLRGQAGVDIARNGGLGGSTSVFLRGTNSDHVLVLIDGVRAASVTTGTFSWAQLNPAQIERIEIVRGPLSTLYGSDAIGGVIQIFTRDADGASVRAEAGSHETYRLEGGIGGGDEYTWSVNASRVASEGFSAKNSDASFGFNPDDDGYEENSLTAGLGGPLGKNGEFSVRTWYADGEVEFDQGVTETTNNTIRGRFEHRTLDNWEQTFTLGRAHDQRVTDSSFPSDITTQRASLGWQNDIALREGLRLTAGLDFYEDDGENVNPNTGTVTIDESIDNLGLYANLDAKLGANSFNLGVRRDDHSEFGTETTGQIAYGRELTESLRLFGSFGTGFKAPTFNELYFPGFGNPDLKAETSDSLELGVKFHRGENRLRASVYETRVDNLIEAVLVQPPFGFEARNVSEATIQGLEVVWDRNFGRNWSAGADFTYQDAVNDTTGEKLLRRADEKLGLRATRYFGTRGSLTAQAVYKGERQDRGGVTLDSYTLVNLGFNYGLTDSLTLEARVENALDQDYVLVSGYNTSGAAGYLGVRYTP